MSPMFSVIWCSNVGALQLGQDARARPIAPGQDIALSDLRASSQRKLLPWRRRRSKPISDLRSFPHMSRHHPIVVGALGLAVGCAGILGIENAECDPAYSSDCATDGVPSVGGSSTRQTDVASALPSNSGS